MDFQTVVGYNQHTSLYRTGPIAFPGKKKSACPFIERYRFFSRSVTLCDSSLFLDLAQYSLQFTNIHLRLFTYLNYNRFIID